jgi:hypothetical protein
VAVASSILIPQFPQPPDAYSRRDQDELRSLIRNALLDIQRAGVGGSDSVVVGDILTAFYNHGTSTTFGDTGLEVLLPETGFYALVGSIQHFCDATGDGKIAFSFTNGASGGGTYTNSTTVSGVRTSVNSGVLNFSGAAAERIFNIQGFVEVTAVGSLKLLAAAQSSGGSYCIINEGTWVRLEKLADT